MAKRDDELLLMAGMYEQWNNESLQLAVTLMGLFMRKEGIRVLNIDLTEVRELYRTHRLEVGFTADLSRSIMTIRLHARAPEVTSENPKEKNDGTD